MRRDITKNSGRNAETTIKGKSYQQQIPCKQPAIKNHTSNKYPANNRQRKIIPATNTLLFLKRDGGFGGKRKTSFHMEKKFSSSPRFPQPLSKKYDQRPTAERTFFMSLRASARAISPFLRRISSTYPGSASSSALRLRMGSKKLHILSKRAFLA